MSEDLKPESKEIQNFSLSLLALTACMLEPQLVFTVFDFSTT